MPEAQSTGNRTRANRERDSQSRARSDNSIDSTMSAGPEAAEFLQEGLLDSPFSQSTFERHAALLGDPRMSNSMHTRQRAAIVQQLQRDYGNQYVQRLVNQIQKKRAEGIQTKLTVGPAGDKYEQEVDRVGTQIVSMTNSANPSGVQPDEKKQLNRSKADREPQVPVEGGDVTPHIGPDDSTEREATRLTSQMAQGQMVRVLQTADGRIARQGDEQNEAEAIETRLNDNGITLNSSGNCTDRSNATCTSVEGIRQETVDGLIAFRNQVGLDLTMTGGTEAGHAAGPNSHENGYKVDIRPNDTVDSYIEDNFTDAGTRESDGAQLYTDADGNQFAREGNHWDITFY